jgi:hypothetical protein
MRQTKLQDILISQSQNPRNYPNIPTSNFGNLERDIQKVWSTTYGIKVINGRQSGKDNFVFTGSEEAFEGLEIHLLVLAVHGTKKDSATKNDNPQARNEIILLNKSWIPLETTRGSTGSSGTIEMTLSTRKNKLTVTMDAATCKVGPGVFSVKQDLIEEITDIFDGITYQNLSSSPVLKYVYRIKP